MLKIFRILLHASIAFLLIYLATTIYWATHGGDHLAFVVVFALPLVIPPITITSILYLIILFKIKKQRSTLDNAWDPSMLDAEGDATFEPKASTEYSLSTYEHIAAIVFIGLSILFILIFLAD